MDEKYMPIWEKCIAFHGHECGGLMIGFQAALYAGELLGFTARSEDEEIVCIAETDNCAVDAIQIMTGCTVGKGNLIFNMQGKNAFSFYDRHTLKSVRLVLRPTPLKTKEERLSWLKDGDYHEMFEVKAASQLIPEKARIFKNYTCARCGERTAESHIHLQNGETVCGACFHQYTRGL